MCDPRSVKLGFDVNLATDLITLGLKHLNSLLMLEMWHVSQFNMIRNSWSGRLNSRVV